MRHLHQKLERKDDIRRRPAPQFFSRARDKLAPPLGRRARVEVRSVALHAAQLQVVGRTQRLTRRVPTLPVQVEQAVVRVRGNMSQVVAERHVEHVYVQRVLRR